MENGSESEDFVEDEYLKDDIEDEVQDEDELDEEDKENDEDEQNGISLPPKLVFKRSTAVIQPIFAFCLDKYVHHHKEASINILQLQRIPSSKQL